MSVFSRSKAPSWRSGASTWRRSRSARVGPVLPRRGLDPGVLDHRRQVDLGDVAVPVDDPRVEAERRPVVAGQAAVPQLEQVLDAVDRLALGVGAVELDVGEGPLDLARACSSSRADHSACLPRSGSVCSAFSARSSTTLARFSWPCTRPRPGKRPLGHDDGLALGVVDRVLGEPLRTRSTRRPVAQRVHEPDATWTMNGARRRGRGRGTAQMAATTRSTGITSMTPSGTPGNSFSRPGA
jgi:hypothetical protein